MNKTVILATLLLVFSGMTVLAQETFPRNDVRDTRVGAYALINATIVVDHATTIQNGTLIIKSGKIEQVGANLKVPAGYAVIDLKGKFIYPSLIDIYSNYGLPAVESPRGGNAFASAEQIESKTKGAYNSNEAIRSHYNASEEFSVNAKGSEDLRMYGFGSVLSFRPDGIARGTSAVVTLGDGKDNTNLIRARAAAHFSFNRGTSTQNFPRSMMGYIALLRQTYLDAEWYGSQNPRPFADQSLEAWIQNKSLPQIFEANEWHNILRADKVGDEFGVQYIIKGGGDEYKRLDEIRSTNAPLIVPVNFPDPYEVDDPFDAASVSLADMKHWELAPSNAGMLEKNGSPFALTAYGLKNLKDFLPNVRKAMENGLSESAALQALTSTPAKLLRVDDQIGSLRKGLVANFIVTSGKLFDEKTIIHQNWVQGQQYVIKPLNALDANGKYSMTVGGKEAKLEITGEATAPKAKVTIDTTTVNATITI